MWPKRLPAVAAHNCKARLKLDLPSDNSDFLNCSNVMSVGGKLRSSCCATWLRFAFDVYKLLAEYDGKLYMLGAQGLWYYQDHSTTNFLNKTEYTACACVFQGKLNIMGPNMGAYVIEKRYTFQDNVGGISLAVCDDRMFALEANNDIAITTAGQTGWQDYFRLTPNTKLGALVTVGKKLYALGDTCYVFDPSTAVDNLDVTFRALCHGVGCVQTDTQAVFGKKAVFATDCGLRLLQSDNVTSIFEGLNSFVSFVGSVACAHKGLYYVSCKRLDGTQERNDVTLILDVHHENIVGILDMGSESLCSSGEILYLLRDKKLYLLEGVATESSWFQTVDFGNSSLKFLDTLFIKCKQDAELTITGDNSSVSYKVKGNGALQRIPVCCVGRSFTFQIRAQNGLQVDYAELTARRYEV